MTEKQGQIQLGKQGVSENFIKTLGNHFKTCKVVRVSILKSARGSCEDIKKIKNEILEKLGKNFSARVIGFVVVVKKWRKNVR